MVTLPGLAGTSAADRCLVMGVVNVTPDSFSDGGRWYGAGAAIEHGLEMVAQGADIVDVGGESTRPGAARVSAEEELRRVKPVVTELVRAGWWSASTRCARRWPSGPSRPGSAWSTT